MRLYTGITKSKSSASSIVVPSIFVIHLVSVAKFLNASFVASNPIIVIHLLLKYKHRYNHKDLI